MWFTAIVMGFAGSLHCLGMCSPLAMAVTSLRRPFLINRIVYNGGRIFCYALLGAGVSSFGSLFRLSGIQNVITISLGCALIAVGVAGISHPRIPVLGVVIEKLTFTVKSLFSRFLQKKTWLSMGMMGMLNGLLPCGLTYFALTYCLTFTAPTTGFFFMLIFGAGTLPVMLGFTSVLQSLINRFHFNFRSFTTVAMIVLGTLLITRSVYVHYHDDAAHQQQETVVICK